MLKPLRRKRLINITMWILVVVFAAWGIGSVATSGKNYAGLIFGKKITVQEYNRSYNSVLIRAKMTYGDELAKMERFLNLKEQAWERLILKHEARRRFMRASNKEVIEQIASMRLFHRNGAFNQRLYEYIVGNVFRATPREFEESVRDYIIMEKLANDVTKDIGVTEDEIRQEYISEKQQGDLSFILIKPEEYREKVSTTDEELLAFYREHKDSFMSPIELNVSYLQIAFADENEKEDARLDAEEVMAFIRGGKGLGQAAVEYGLELKETGFFSINSAIPEIGLSYPFALAALNLKEGQISDIVEISGSFCIIQLNGRKDPQILSFEEAVDKVKDMLTQEKTRSMAMAKAQRLIDRLKEEGLTLEELASSYGYNVSTSKGVTRKSYIEEIGPSDSFVDATFSLNVGEATGPVETERGYCLVRLDHIKAIDEDDFKAQKDAIGLSLVQKKKSDYFQRWFSQLKAKAGLVSNL